MKFTNRKLLGMTATLNVISGKSLPIKASYAIAKNLTKIQSELDIFNKERTKLVDKFCKKDENGKPVIKNGNFEVKQENLEEWNKNMNELLKIEVEIEPYKFSLNVFEGKDYELTPSELMAIDFMIEE